MAVKAAGVLGKRKIRDANAQADEAQDEERKPPPLPPKGMP